MLKPTDRTLYYNTKSAIRLSEILIQNLVDLNSVQPVFMTALEITPKYDILVSGQYNTTI